MSDRLGQGTPDFNTQLATLASAAADAADLRTAAAIRSRGGRRTRRTRITGALLATAAAGAVVATTLNVTGTRDPEPPVVTPSVTPPPSWETVRPGAWLPADTYPFHDRYRWVHDGEPVADSSEPQTTYMCQRSSLAPLGPQGFQTSSVKGTAGGWSDSRRNWNGAQRLIFFASPTAARRGYQLIMGDVAGCQRAENVEGAKRKPPITVQVEQTATIAQGSAWSRKATGDLYGASTKDEHLLVVQRGSIVSLLWLDWNEGPHPAYDTKSDQPLLQQLSTRLTTTYGPG